MYRDECRVEYDTTCHQEVSHSFTIRGYEPQKMKRDLKETLVPVTQGKGCCDVMMFVTPVTVQDVTPCPGRFVTRCQVWSPARWPAPSASPCPTSGAPTCSAP